MSSKKSIYTLIIVGYYCTPDNKSKGNRKLVTINFFISDMTNCELIVLPQLSKINHMNCALRQ